MPEPDKLTIFLTGMVSFTLLYQGFSNRKRILSAHREVLDNFRFTMLVESWLAFGLFISAFVVIDQYFPVLSDIGWLKALSTNHISIPGAVLLPSSPKPENISNNFSALLKNAIPLLIFAVLPLFTEFEERVFRKGKNSIGKMLFSSVAFGLVHMILGIPLSIAIALIIPGMIVHLRYIRERNKLLKEQPLIFQKNADELSMKRSSALHYVYNAQLLLVLVVIGQIIL